MDTTLRNQAGDVIAWLSDDGGCRNDACKAARRAGRRVHITPSPRDPRHMDASLVLPDYHFTTADEAAAALEDAWNTAETAYTVAQRDDAYARGVPVKIHRNEESRQIVAAALQARAVAR